MFTRRLWLSLLLCVSCSTASLAQEWPTRPVRFFVGSGPGAGPDVILRMLADRLSKVWGQPVIVENRPGAGGIVGTAAVAQAAPDGYTFLFGLGSALAMNQFLFKSLPFDPEKDFTPVVGVGWTPMVIAINAKHPANSIPELIAAAKAQPEKIGLGTTNKTAAFLTMRMFMDDANVQFLHVFYKSAPQALMDMMGDQVQVFSDALAAVPDLKDSRLKVLAVTSPKRLPNMPDIPAVSETLPGFVSYGWYAIMAPAGTPARIVEKVNRDANAILRDPEMVQRLHGYATYEAGGTPEELDKFIRTERERLKRATQAAKIEPE